MRTTGAAIARSEYWYPRLVLMIVKIDYASSFRQNLLEDFRRRVSNQFLIDFRYPICYYGCIFCPTRRMP
jgi:hypothetical protein